MTCQSELSAVIEEAYPGKIDAPECARLNNDKAEQGWEGNWDKPRIGLLFGGGETV
jgi:hypothetical protein